MNLDALPSLTRLFSYLALVGALYAGYELLIGTSVWRRWSALAARVWILLLLGTVGVDEVFFRQNALLTAGYLLGLPLFPFQVAIVASLVVATWVWIES